MDNDQPYQAPNSGEPQPISPAPEATVEPIAPETSAEQPMAPAAPTTPTAPAVTEVNNVSPVQPAPQKKQIPVVAIIIAAVAFLAIAGTAVAFVLIRASTNKNSNNNETSSLTGSCGRTAKYEDLTFEEAYSFKKTVLNDPDCNAQALANDEDLVTSNKNDIYRLLYSYSNPSEINSIANDSVMNLRDDGQTIDFEIIQKEHYAIVKGDKKGSPHDNHITNGIIFDKKYVNYYDSDPDKIGQIDKIEFTNFDEDWIKKAAILMRIASNEQGSIYDYVLTDEGDNYKITTRNIGMGLDAENSSANKLKYTLTKYEAYFTINKTTGTFESVKVRDSGGRFNTTKTWELAEEQNEEMAKLSGLNYTTDRLNL